jgi:hypothetical protein
VRDLLQVNLALLAKWRWRYLLEEGGLWRDLLIARYGVCYPSPHLGGKPSGLRNASPWWSVISTLGTDKDVIGDWFSEGVVRVVGNGMSTHFWRLFQLSLQVDGMVGELGHWEGDDWVWDLRWRRSLFVWEMNLLTDLLVVAFRASRVAREDVWSWTHSPDSRFSVKSAYSLLIQGLPDPGILEGVVLQAVSKVWKSWAPSKVIVFSWQLLLDRIPTWDNLFRRGVPLPQRGGMCFL